MAPYRSPRPQQPGTLKQRKPVEEGVAGADEGEGEGEVVRAARNGTGQDPLGEMMVMTTTTTMERMEAAREVTTTLPISATGARRSSLSGGGRKRPTTGLPQLGMAERGFLPAGSLLERKRNSQSRSARQSQAGGSRSQIRTFRRRLQLVR